MTVRLLIIDKTLHQHLEGIAAHLKTAKSWKILVAKREKSMTKIYHLKHEIERLKLGCLGFFCFGQLGMYAFFNIFLLPLASVAISYHCMQLIWMIGICSNIFLCYKLMRHVARHHEPVLKSAISEFTHLRQQWMHMLKTQPEYMADLAQLRVDEGTTLAFNRLARDVVGGDEENMWKDLGALMHDYAQVCDPEVLKERQSLDAQTQEFLKQLRISEKSSDKNNLTALL